MFTVPNLISIARGMGVPLFLWVYLALGSNSWALAILILGGISDYLDGKIARKYNQVSSLGEKLDPAIDRIYLAAIIIAFVVKEVIPLWIAIALVSRDLILGALIVRTRRVLEVTYLGKAATFNLLYALPFLLLAKYSLMRVFGWSFAIWGIGLYLLTGFDYASKLLRTKV